MSNPRYNTQSTNPRTGSKGGGSYGRGQISIPTPVEAGAVTTKGVAPAKGKAEEFAISKGKVTGTSLGMGAATKGGKYTWS
tara:strand:+ start:120 stop:362 length:243 start_codon:yes stop_codon:yes gene_type:complete